MGRGQHIGPLPRQAQLRLAPGERVLQVAWQALVVPPVLPTSPDDAVCALLTNHRVLLLRGEEGLGEEGKGGGQEREG